MDEPVYFCNPYFGSMTFAPVEPGVPITVESAKVEGGRVHLLFGRPNTPHGEEFPVLGCFTVRERNYLLVQPLDWMGDGYSYQPVIVRVMGPGIVTTVSDTELQEVLADRSISMPPGMEFSRQALIGDVWDAPKPTPEDIERLLHPLWEASDGELEIALRTEPDRAQRAFPYESLSLMAMQVLHKDAAPGGYLRNVIRIEAYAHFGGCMELLERGWAMKDGEGQPDWQPQRSEISAEALVPLAAAIANLWRDGQPPRIECRPTANDDWVSLNLAVQLDSKAHTLYLSNVDDIHGPDIGALRAVSAEIARLTESLNANTAWSWISRMT